MAESQAKILIADDEVKNIKLLEALLEPQDYTLIKAYDGQEALQQVQRERPDLILLDVMMPVIDGFAVCQTLKNDPETRLIPVVIVTALGRVEDRIKGIEIGADDFLTKPINRDELLARIRTSLRLKRTVERKVNELQWTQEHLSKFVPRMVRRLIAENPRTPTLDLREMDVSVLFVDISGYARLNDTLPNKQVVAIIQQYFSNFLDCIFTNGGDINETSGDGFMTIFTDVDPRQHARKAVNAALQILRRTDRLNEQRDESVEPLAVHIGINSGQALVGSTKMEGTSSTHWTYTASGMVTVVAARIGALAQGGMVFIGAETAQRIGEDFPLKQIGKRRLKNIKQAIPVYQVGRGYEE